MISANEVTPAKIRAVIPDAFIASPYHKLTAGEIVTIKKVIYSVYQAKKDGDYLVRKDGTPVTNTTAYLGLSDGSYGTVKNEIAVGQLISETGQFQDDVVGKYEYDVEIKVKIINTTVRMGKKDYPTVAFEPIA